MKCSTSKPWFSSCFHHVFFMCSSIFIQSLRWSFNDLQGIGCMRRLRKLDQGICSNANGMGAALDVGDLAAVYGWRDHSDHSPCYKNRKCLQVGWLAHKTTEKRLQQRVWQDEPAFPKHSILSLKTCMVNWYGTWKLPHEPTIHLPSAEHMTSCPILGALDWWPAELRGSPESGVSTEISEDSCVARLYQLEFQISISVSIDVSAFISIYQHWKTTILPNSAPRSSNLHRASAGQPNGSHATHFVEELAGQVWQRLHDDYTDTLLWHCYDLLWRFPTSQGYPQII